MLALGHTAPARREGLPGGHPSALLATFVVQGTERGETEVGGPAYGQTGGVGVGVGAGVGTGVGIGVGTGVGVGSGPLESTRLTG